MKKPKKLTSREISNKALIHWRNKEFYPATEMDEFLKYKELNGYLDNHIFDVLLNAKEVEKVMDKSWKEKIEEFIAGMRRTYPRPTKKEITDHLWVTNYVIDKMEEHLLKQKEKT